MSWPNAAAKAEFDFYVRLCGGYAAAASRLGMSEGGLRKIGSGARRLSAARARAIAEDARTLAPARARQVDRSVLMWGAS